MHPRGFQHLSRARGPQSTRARGGDREVMTCQALVQSWLLFRVSNSQLSFSCVSEALFFLIRSNNVIVTHLDTSFFTFCCSQIHTQLHTRYKLYSLIKMPSLPSPETTMTLAGVGMVRFVIPTLLSFSFSFSEESFFETKEEFCVCGFRAMD